MDRIKQITDGIELSKSYDVLLKELKSINELSELTYKMREDGIDIPYVDTFHEPAPLIKQERWSFLRENLSSALKSQYGLFRLRIGEIKNEIFVLSYVMRKHEGSYIYEVVYNSSKTLKINEMLESVTGNCVWGSREFVNDIYIKEK